jgi:hypothetical protein
MEGLLNVDMHNKVRKAGQEVNLASGFHLLGALLEKYEQETRRRGGQEKRKNRGKIV